MRKILCITICLIVLFTCVGCSSNSDNVTLTFGNYYAVGDYEKMMTPYLWLDTENHTFSMGAGSVISYAENGTYQVEDGKIFATSQSTTFVFEIKNSKTLILIDNGDNDYFKIPLKTEFIYSTELK